MKLTKKGRRTNQQKKTIFIISFQLQNSLISKQFYHLSFILFMLLLFCACTPAQVCPLRHVLFFATLVDSNLPGSSIHGIFQAGILEWVAISYSILLFCIYVNNKMNPSKLTTISRSKILPIIKHFKPLSYLLPTSS